MKTYLIKVPQDNQQTAAAFQEVFRQLHETLLGERVSFEMLSTGQNIAFCFSAREAAAQVVAGQVYAIAPDADIVQIPDFTKKLSNNVKCVATELGLQRNDLFPLKYYDEFEGDSLSGLLSVLSKLPPGEAVFIQFVVRPRRDTGIHNLVMAFRRRGERMAHISRFKYWFKRAAAKTFKPRIEQKTQNRMFDVNIRVVSMALKKGIDPSVRLRAICGALSSFNTLDLNQLKIGRVKSSGFAEKFQKRALIRPFLLDTKELATMYHLPKEEEVPNLVHVLSHREPPPRELPTNPRDQEISFFGETNFRDQRTKFGIKRNDRRRHLYVLGKSGVGKSKLLELLIRNDILAGHGVGVLDPHGDLVDNVLQIIPEHRVKDVVLFDPSDLNYPASFNPLERVPEELKMRVTIGFIEIFKKLFGSNWSPRLEHVLRYTTLALLDSDGTTVLSILKMLTDKNYRQTIVRNIQDDVVKNFWVNEFAGWSEKFDNEAITPLLNKVGQFVSTNMIRNIVGQPVNLFDFRSIMDTRKILLMKISKGTLGEENAALLGAIAITKIYQAAMSRADTLEKDRVDFYFYVDEFQNFATNTFDEILSESRKYRLCLTIANQFLGQLEHSIKTTVFGNVGSMISFRIGGEDAKIMSSEFEPRFKERDLINLGVQDFVTKMSIEGETHEAFSGRTLFVENPEKNFMKESIAFSRANYARPLSEVKAILSRWEEGEYDPDSQNQRSKAGHGSSFDEEVEFEEPII
jgi:hypothetical protein